MNDFNYDSDSIDFNFFESEEDNLNTAYSNHIKQNSKIVTTAVIETNPSQKPYISKSTRSKVIKPKKKSPQSVSAVDYLSCPKPLNENQLTLGLIERETLDEVLNNCLAYENPLSNQNSDNSLSEYYEESSNTSSSNSTVTTITSELTSISPLSSLSESSSISSSTDPSSSLGGYSYETNSCSLQGNILPAKVNGFNNKLNDFDCETLNEENNSQTEFKEEKDEEFIKNKLENSDSDNEGTNSKHESIANTECSIYEDQSFDTEPLSELNCYQENNNKEYCHSNSSGTCSELGSDNEEYSTRESDCSQSDHKYNSSIENEIEKMSLSPQQSSLKSNSVNVNQYKRPGLVCSRRRGSNMTFSREQLIKIERENLILLKKIMAHAKPKTVSLNQSLIHKKPSTAINRAKQQKKIDKDNYILYSKISAMSRMKNVC